ncbi:hypothetical protein GCM10009741_74740 [Kribbella lupini]|uniref:Uncharacterized protein n=1 Tax=Kribbella lupini TaxID=291602 RepID=A0ABN2CHN9_9ACTN
MDLVDLVGDSELRHRDFLLSSEPVTCFQPSSPEQSGGSILSLPAVLGEYPRHETLKPVA